MTVPARFSRGNRGAALVVALVFLIIITALALAATRSITLELRMALNSELAASARQVAFGLGEAVSANPGATPVVGTTGNRICTSVASYNAVAPDEAPCNTYGLAIPAEAIPAQGNFWVGVELLGSETQPPPRAVGSSLEAFGAAAFRVHSRYVDPRGNRADAYEGVLVLIPRTSN